MVGANAAGLIGMSKEHLAISLALSVPVVICITKIDMTPANVLAETIKHVVKVLKSPGCRLVRPSRLRLGSLTLSKQNSRVCTKRRNCSRAFAFIYWKTVRMLLDNVDTIR